MFCMLAVCYTILAAIPKTSDQLRTEQGYALAQATRRTVASCRFDNPGL